MNPKGTIGGVQRLMASNLGSRGLTFLVNLLVTRASPAAVLGIAVVKLEPIASTILFLSREHARVTAVRGGYTPAYQPVLLGILVSITLSILLRADQHFYVILLYILSAILELCAESMVLVCLSTNRLDLRAKAESRAFLARCFTLSILILVPITSSPEVSSLLAYAMAQIVYSVILYHTYSSYALVPPSKTSHQPSNPLLLQSLLKHALTEGDKFLILWLLPSTPDMGAYAFANNLGALVARILFSPIEDGARIHFGRKRQHAGKVFSALVRANIVLGAVFTAFGPWYTDVLVRIIGGERWSETSAAKVLAWFCVYIPIMGVNGITEGFMQTVGDKSVIAMQSFAMILFSAVFVATSWITVEKLDMSASGFVVANIVNLALRALVSLTFAKKTLIKGEIVLRDCMPSGWLAVGFVSSAALCRASKIFFDSTSWIGMASHVSVGVVAFIIMTYLIFVSEREFFGGVFKEYKEQSEKKKE